MAATPTTGDREADPGRPGPTGRADETTQPGGMPGGGAADVTEGTLDAAAGDDDLIQGGEASGTDFPPAPPRSGRHGPITSG